jgi:hypothetical protein
MRFVRHPLLATGLVLSVMSLPLAHADGRSVPVQPKIQPPKKKVPPTRPPAEEEPQTPPLPYWGGSLPPGEVPHGHPAAPQTEEHQAEEMTASTANLADDDVEIPTPNPRGAAPSDPGTPAPNPPPAEPGTPTPPAERDPPGTGNNRRHGPSTPPGGEPDNVTPANLWGKVSSIRCKDVLDANFGVIVDIDSNMRDGENYSLIRFFENNKQQPGFEGTLKFWVFRQAMNYAHDRWVFSGSGYTLTVESEDAYKISIPGKGQLYSPTSFDPRTLSCTIIP